MTINWGENAIQKSDMVSAKFFPPSIVTNFDVSINTTQANTAGSRKSKIIL